MLDIRIEPCTILSAPVVEIRLAGELDFYETGLLQGQFSHLVDRVNGMLLLDVTELHFIDCSGARFLLRLAGAVTSRGFPWAVVAGNNPCLHRLIELLRWSGTLPVYADREEALGALLSGYARGRSESALNEPDPDEEPDDQDSQDLPSPPY